MKKNIRGFSLIEVVLVIVIMGVLAVVVVPMIYEASESATATANIATASQQAEFTLGQMSRKLRQIRSNTSTGLSTTASNEVAFTMVNGESITYTLNGTNLEVTTSSGTGVLADNVSALTIGYYDAAGEVTSTVTEMRYIKIDLTVSIGTKGSLPLQAVVYLRNSR